MVRWLAVVVWMVVILFNSSIPAPPSSAPSLVSFLLAKAGHVAEYAALGWLLIGALVSPTGGVRLIPARAVVATVAVGACLAVFDETRQLFVYSRTGQPLDVAIDLVSVLGGALLGTWSWRSRAGQAATPSQPDRGVRPGEQPAGEHEHQQVHR